MELIAPGVPATQVFGDLIGAPRAAKPSCNLAEAIGFLKLLDAGGRHNLVAIDPATRQIMGRTFEPGDWPSIGNWICEHSGRRNLYLTVNEPVSGAPHDKLKKEHIGALRAVFADLDPQGKAALETERAEIASKVETLQCSVAPPILDLIETRGIRAAAQAAIDVCEDKNAPAPARATAAGLILRAAALGGFGKQGERERDLEAHQMDGNQLQAAIDGLRKREAALTRRARLEGSGGAEHAPKAAEASVFD